MVKPSQNLLGNYLIRKDVKLTLFNPNGRISARLDNDLKKDLFELADETNASMSFLIRLALRELLRGNPHPRFMEKRDSKQG